MDFLNRVELEPAVIPIEGLSSPVQITRFSFDHMREVLLPKVGELTVEEAALYFVNDKNYSHTSEDLGALRNKIGADQIVQIYQAGMRVNGCVSAGEDDPKKS